MKTVYGYTRVSTRKQGEHGVSLEQQKEAIQRYVDQNDLVLVEWFEERETAAKSGRTVFKRMLKKLQSGSVSGVVIHKVDRSTRNLRDWVDLVDLHDQGVAVHFSNESIDLTARGGRLSADIQAVVAADFIRNLRQEVKKGVQGRLKQGLYPFPAPVGYVDNGKGKPKTIDPIKGPIVRTLFEYYSTGDYTLKELVKTAKHLGLTNAGGGKVTLNGISTILNNRFYTGVIYIKRTGETYAGVHEPLISQALFETVHDVLTNKRRKGVRKLEYLYRRLFQCKQCGHSMVPEKQKGFVYYRCHYCTGTSVREEAINALINQTFEYFTLSKVEIKDIEAVQEQIKEKQTTQQEDIAKGLMLEKANFEKRLSLLTDKLLDATIDEQTYLVKKEELIKQIQLIKERIHKNTQGLSKQLEQRLKFLELYKSFNLTYEISSNRIKRQMLQSVSSNRYIHQKNIEFKLQKPFQELCDLKKSISGAPHRGNSRTLGGKNTACDEFRKRLEAWVDFPAEEADGSP